MLISLLVTRICSFSDKTRSESCYFREVREKDEKRRRLEGGLSACQAAKKLIDDHHSQLVSKQYSQRMQIRLVLMVQVSKNRGLSLEM